MNPHLSEAELLDLDRVKALGPLFEQASLHLSECAACRRLRVEAEALRALELESAPALERSALRAAFRGVRQVSVEERLAAGAGEDAAREILLAASKRRREPGSPAVFYAAMLLLLVSVAWWRLRPGDTAPPPRPVESLPFEFQPSPEMAPQDGPLAESVSAEAAPKLEAVQQQQELQLERDARRMVAEHLRDSQSTEEGSEPQRQAAPTAQAFGPSTGSGLPPSAPVPFGMATALPRPQASATPSPLPTRPPQPAATLIPTRPALPTALPSPAPTKPLPTAAPSPSTGPVQAPVTPQSLAPAPPKPALQVENARFSPGMAKAEFRLVFPESSSLEIRIFDAAGKNVRLVTEGNPGAGILHYDFDGISDSGAALPPGTYFARVMTRWFSRVETLEILP